MLSPLNVNVVTEGRVVEVPKVTGDLGILYEAIGQSLGNGRALEALLEYIAHDPDGQSPAHSLSPQTAIGLLREAADANRRKAIAELIPVRGPSVLTRFKAGVAETRRARLLERGIRRL